MTPLGDIEKTRAWLATRPAQPATITIDTLPDSVWVVAVEFAGSRNPIAATGTPERAELVAAALAHYETTQSGALFAHVAATTGAVPTAWPDSLVAPVTRSQPPQQDEPGMCSSGAHYPDDRTCRCPGPGWQPPKETR